MGSDAEERVRPKRKGSLVARIEERIDVLLESITPESIASAPVGQVATAVGTLIEKARAIRAADEPSAEVLAEIIKRHVTDEGALKGITRDLREAYGCEGRRSWERPRASDGTFRRRTDVEGVG